MKRFKIVNGHVVKTTLETQRTWWNFEPADAKRVRVIVGTAPSGWWCADLKGQERAAVRVDYDGSSLYLDNEDGSGWAKVTAGRGSPRVPHKSLVVEREVVEVRS